MNVCQKARCASSIPFKNLRSGDKFSSGFFKRNPVLSLRRRCNFEKYRALATSPINISEHYELLQQEYEEYGICSGAQVLNLNESDFPTKTAYRARAKRVLEARGRRNLIEIKWPANAERVTLMPVVCADGRA